MTKALPRILIVEDERTNIRILDDLLKDHFLVSVALNSQQALNRVFSDNPPDLILLDVGLPDVDGFETCRRIKEREETSEIPIIFITAMSDEEDERRGLELGAVDYITKPFRPALVLTRLKNHLEFKRQRDLLNILSSLDGLTGIPNRRRFEEFLDREWNRTRRSGSPVSLILADIDHFKKYNDNYGHAVGDDCLREVSSIIAATVSRNTDLVARYGGEEFVCVLPETDLEGAVILAEKVRQAVRAAKIPHAFSPVRPHVTLSMGVASMSAVKVDGGPRQLVEMADEWLYVAKNKGRDQVAFDLRKETEKDVLARSLAKDERATRRPKQRILIVDDESINATVLDAIFKSKYETNVALTGEQALKRAVREPQPDIILLDIQMPGMDGYAVCRALKGNPATRDIPILFITVLSDQAEEKKGLELGAVDYISKPFNPSIVLARVNTHLKLRHILTMLAERNRNLEEMLHLRESVERVAHHDLKRPLARIIEQTERLGAAGCEGLLSIEASAFELLYMINRSLDLWKLERNVYEVDFRPVDLVKVTSDVIRCVDPLCCLKGVRIVSSLNESAVGGSESLMVDGEELLCYSMLADLIKNAVEASPKGKEVSIVFCPGEKSVEIRIHNESAVPVEIRGSFFEKGITRGKEGAGGLGAYIARLIAEVMRGALAMETDDISGTSVTIRLPRSETLALGHTQPG